jgi:CheY-like chemotaxis protein
MLNKLHIKTVHVQRIKSELATAKTGLWISLPESESLLQEAGISPSNWICLLPTSGWQEHEERNVLLLPVHFSALQRSLNVALGIEDEEPNRLKAHYRNHYTFQANILVAEDSMTNQEVAKSMLGLLGCETWLADNGAEAVEQVNLQTPDLVLMDCQMPVMDGYAATKAIRKNWPNIPIVALTAGMGDNLRQQCLDAGMNQVMSKPFSLQELEQTLLHFLPEACLSLSSGQVTQHNVAMGLRQDDKLGPKEPLLDIQTVDTLLKISRDTGNPIYDRVLDAFTQEAEKLIAKLNEHVNKDDIDVSAIANIAHALKSMAGNCGAKALYELCRELEVKLSNNEHHEITVLAQSIDASFSISCAKLDTFRNVSGKYN